MTEFLEKLLMETNSRNKLVRRATLLSWFTIGYNLIEGVVSIFFGITEESVSLAGFGMDSFIEVGSALLVLWRLRGENEPGAGIALEREKRATKGIGLLFIALALTITAGSAIRLWSRQPPETTVPGIIIALLSLSFMYYLYRSKMSVALALNSSTVLQDAACSRACFNLSLILLAGSLLYALFPQLWWADSLAALLLALLIGREGVDTLRVASHPDFAGGCGCHTDLKSKC